MIRLSIVIPTIGRKQELFNTINDLVKQNLDKNKWECLVIAQSEIDSDIIKNIAVKNELSLKLFYLEQPNASLARNIGLLEARGEIVLFLDDDLIIDKPEFLDNHLKHFDNQELCGVVGQVTDITKIIRNDRHKWSYKKRVGWLYFPSNYNKRDLVLNGGAGNLSVRKIFALNIGGMDANFEKGAHREESDFCLRLTKKYGSMIYDPEAAVIHLGSRTGGSRSWGINRGIQPLHHIVGEWYFILKGLRIKTVYFRDLTHHLASLFFRQIFNEQNRRNPIALVLSFFKSIVGLVKATVLVLKMQKQSEQVSVIDYKIIYSNY